MLGQYEGPLRDFLKDTPEEILSHEEFQLIICEHFKNRRIMYDDLPDPLYKNVPFAMKLIGISANFYAIMPDELQENRELARAAIEKDIEKMTSRSLVKGIRSKFDPNTHNPEKFIQGLQLLGRYNLSFDLHTNIEREASDVEKVVAKCPDTQFMLNHMGKPDIKNNTFDSWSKAIKKISAFPNISCKISGIITRAGKDWKADDLKPFVETALEAFGPDRVAYGGDWPVVLLGGSYIEWMEALTLILKGYGQENTIKLFTGNAEAFYGI